MLSLTNWAVPMIIFYWIVYKHTEIVRGQHFSLVEFLVLSAISFIPIFNLLIFVLVGLLIFAGVPGGNIRFKWKL